MENELKDFMASYPPDIQRITLRAREFILTAMPGAIEMVDPPSKIIAYGTSRKYSDLVFALAPFENHVNLMFARGASLPDPAGLLFGTGKKARHARLETPGDLEKPELIALIKIALDN
jgi:hypothetical protein